MPHLNRKYFSIRAKGKQTADIFIYEQIGKDYWDDSGVGAKQFAQDLKALGDIDKIILRINSPGGSVFEGLAIYNTLNAHSAEKEVHIDGIAASIASVVAMVGDPIIMPENALLMIHDPTGLVIGDAEDMRKMAETLDKVKDSILSAYMSKTQMSSSEIADLMSEETWMSAEEAVHYGFADQIAEPVRIAAHFNFSMFKHVPNKLKNFGGYKRMKDLDKNKDKDENDKVYRKDFHAERERVDDLLAIGKEFKCMDLASEFISEEKSPDDLRKEILGQIKSKTPGEGPNFKHISGVSLMHGNRPFKNFGEQLMAIKNASLPGRKPDNRLFDISNAAAGMNETVPSEGGFAVQEDFTTVLLQKANEVATLAPLCLTIPVLGNGLKAPVLDETSRATGSRLGGVQAYWTMEGGEVTSPKKPKLAMLELGLKKLMGISYMTDELLSDASALESVVTRGFTDELAFMLDAAIVNGSGAGQPLGILKSNALLAVDKEVGQLADTIQAENVINMYARMHKVGKRRAVWLVNAETWPQHFQLNMIFGTTAVPLYMPPGGLSQSPYGTLFGRPVIECEQCEALGDLGDIIFADLGEYLLIDKGGLNFQSSMHVRFLTDEMCYRFVYRVDGQPIWKAPLIPYKGTKTVSPFIALEAR